VLGHEIIVIGASAGGVERLSRLVSELPADPPAAVFVALHTPPTGYSVPPPILSRNGRLPAAHPRDGEPIGPGQIYGAPPDHHMLTKDRRIRLTRGPHENSDRPAIDPLLRTAARSCAERVVGVILSGLLDDGTLRLLEVKKAGGLAIVHDPIDALYDGMPRSAIENVTVDAVVPVSEMAPLLVRLTGQPVARTEPVMPRPTEPDGAELEIGAPSHDHGPGSPAVYACPSGEER
jgi:two-component system chemotaxis response regulator CheB